MNSRLLDATALENLLSDLAGHPEPVRDLINTYISELPKMVAQLKDGLAQGRPERVAQVAHSLKSTSAMIGAASVMELSRELEDLGRDGRLDGAAEKVARIEALQGPLTSELRAWPAR